MPATACSRSSKAGCCAKKNDNRFDVDLDAPPAQRWNGIEAHAEAANELLDYYVRDLGGLEQFGDTLIATETVS